LSTRKTLVTREEALHYHAGGRPGKVQVMPTKATMTQRDLSLAYTPGVAEPCREIAEDPNEVFRYTAKGNLVAVVTNGTAVLGLGNIGALAGKPVMEGKAVLFKRFADVDVFDIEIASEDPDDVVRACQLIAPSFGGINLEDIRAPECFEIETRLTESLDIPVFHDDQHGTAIISGAALLNALHITGRAIEDTQIVISGAGASGIACARLYRDLGARLSHIMLVDSRGVIYKGRGEGVKSMAGSPIIFAMANPDPEITPDEVRRVRSDAIMATGRSDYPNQVNNVLGFPFIFRGALDVRARRINEEMKLAAVHALAELARRGEAIPEVVRRAYPQEHFDFGTDYIIPKPFDPRVLLYVPPAVAQAAMESGVARQQVDLAEYGRHLEETVSELAHL
jgi:malate dehydrogenase (oxaloacetate-decarboxylating)(NADP+)